MKRRIIGVTAAVVLAVVGTLVLLAWVRGAEDRALAGERTVDVLVVREAVPKGTPADQLGERVATEKVSAKVRAEGGVSDVADLAGRVAAVDLVPGEQVVAGRFADPEAQERSGEVEVPEGLQEVTVALEPQRALGGDVRAGDTVGVFSSFASFDVKMPDGSSYQTSNSTHLILHKVLVTRVQADVPAASAPASEGDDAEAAPQPPPTTAVFVTLAVDAPSAERIVFTAEHGTLWLSDESDTATEDGTREQTRETIYE